jgi:capsular polysaccharide biosynthesis protein
MRNLDLMKYRDNRPSSKFSKIKRWKVNPVGAVARLLEFAYFGQPVISFFIGKAGNLESITHISKSINMNESDENLNYLNNVRIDLRSNFIQLDTGHVFNGGMIPNEIYSGQYWNQMRDVRKSKVKGLLPGIFYPVASQKYFFHFLLEEFPEILSANQTIEGINFISLESQPRFVVELCELAGVRLQILEKSVQFCEKLVTPTYLRANSMWSLEQLRALRASTVIDQSYPRKILLLRKGKARSDVDFEESLTNFVAPFGFQVVDPENYSSSEQINIFFNATEIVAIHGAALSNLVFSNSHCKVFEIFSHPYRTYFFREIAKINGNPYVNSEIDSVFTELDDWLKSA